MRPINRFLLDHGYRIATNPCISPDACLDWPTMRERIRRDEVRHHQASRFTTAHGAWELVEDADGDHAWLVNGTAPLADGIAVDARHAYPATWDNLLVLKNLVQEHDPGSTIFPSAASTLRKRSIGVGARFTTLHWPAVAWAMAHLDLSINANQNSIPRELVWDVEAMGEGRLGTIAFPFIGAQVPEGHQGQSVEGMSQGAVLSFLKCGFHQRRLPWGFNADHQPVGGAFDVREDRLVSGCLLATSITLDISPELNATPTVTDAIAWCDAHIPATLRERVRGRIAAAGTALDADALAKELARLWPACVKLQQRDRAYAAARATAFTTAIGRDYLRELSVDELPGLTTPATLATILALCEALEIPVHFVAPAFGFEKNRPFTDQAELERRVNAVWPVCRAFGVSLGVHSGSGKSADNYRTIGRITGGDLEIKTSGRYTYEMGRALAASDDAGDASLWHDWYGFTRDLATRLAAGGDAASRTYARTCIGELMQQQKRPAGILDDEPAWRQALAETAADPDHMLWYEYNFLYVLAAGGSSDALALGDHGPAGYRQRARFYAVSDDARLRYAKLVADYLCFLAETTGLVDAATVAKVRDRLSTYATLAAMLADVA